MVQAAADRIPQIVHQRGCQAGQAAQGNYMQLPVGELPVQAAAVAVAGMLGQRLTAAVRADFTVAAAVRAAGRQAEFLVARERKALLLFNTSQRFRLLSF